jgi:hypothetical protein
MIGTTSKGIYKVTLFVKPSMLGAGHRLSSKCSNMVLIYPKFIYAATHVFLKCDSLLCYIYTKAINSLKIRKNKKFSEEKINVFFDKKNQCLDT